MIISLFINLSCFHCKSSILWTLKKNCVQTFMASSSSSSSKSSGEWKHDVFLSFRGEDTRNNFTTYLYAALCRRKIETFIDFDLNRGEEISPSLFKLKILVSPSSFSPKTMLRSCNSVWCEETNWELWRIVC